MLIKSIIFVAEPEGFVDPPMKIPRILLLVALPALAVVISPKSVVFPVVAIVINSMIFCLVPGETDKFANIPLVELEVPPDAPYAATLNSPKGTAFPPVAISW